ncbi:nuclear transport factor 2 family protein [Algibacter mikhailovii]|uniref:Uncharacterized protein n=1 Tax=Algibacter mikhailovii TaxID=425498 RepID=A0A918RAA9_9FLAO|nr:hypothetical protein [Algibacter mikhailovii]GGZ91810.1 hypothetical protein GCM10007028_32810 [Algibacter mikhailovii]
MKNALLILCCLSFLLFNCEQGQKNQQANLDLIEKYVESVENLDYEVMTALLDDSYMGYGPSINDSINKTNAIASWKNNVEYLYESIRYEKSRNATVLVDSGENQGDWVSNWAQLDIVYKSDQSKVTIWANTIYQIKNGKIIKSYTFYNEADALEQLGYTFY